MQVDVRSAIPRTVPATKNLISADRADDASSHEYAPQKIWSPAHPCKCSSADDDFRGLLSHSFCARRRWDGNGLSATRLSLFVCNQKNLHLLCIYIHAEGGERTGKNRHKSQTLTAITARQKPTCYKSHPLLAIRQETNGHYSIIAHQKPTSEQNAQPLWRNIRTKVRSTTSHGHGLGHGPADSARVWQSFILFSTSQ
jgi:hypothetical protein